jgi:hypothetical protein
MNALRAVGLLLRCPAAMHCIAAAPFYKVPCDRVGSLAVGLRAFGCGVVPSGYVSLAVGLLAVGLGLVSLAVGLRAAGPRSLPPITGSDHRFASRTADRVGPPLRKSNR